MGNALTRGLARLRSFDLVLKGFDEALVLMAFRPDVANRGFGKVACGVALTLAYSTDEISVAPQAVL